LHKLVSGAIRSLLLCYIIILSSLTFATLPFYYEVSSFTIPLTFLHTSHTTFPNLHLYFYKLRKNLIQFYGDIMSFRRYIKMLCNFKWDVNMKFKMQWKMLSLSPLLGFKPHNFVNLQKGFLV